MSWESQLAVDLAAGESNSRRKLEARVVQLEADMELLRKQVAALAKWAMEKDEDDYQDM